MKNQNITIHIPVTMLASTWKGDFEKLPPNDTYELIVDYPLEHPAKFPIKTGKNGLSLVALLGKIGQIYDKIYEIDDETADSEDGSPYGIYGHDIYDLNLSGISVDHKTKKIRLSVDS